MQIHPQEFSITVPLPDDRLIEGKVAVTVTTASKVLGVTETHVRRLAKRGELIAIGTGRANRRITVESIRIRRGY